MDPAPSHTRHPKSLVAFVSPPPQSCGFLSLAKHLQVSKGQGEEQILPEPSQQAQEGARANVISSTSQMGKRRLGKERDSQEAVQVTVFPPLGSALTTCLLSTPFSTLLTVQEAVAVKAQEPTGSQQAETTGAQPPEGGETMQGLTLDVEGGRAGCGKRRNQISFTWALASFTYPTFVRLWSGYLE